MEGFSLKNLFSRPAMQVDERREHPRYKLSGKHTILIVDDSKTVVYSLKKLLEEAGYQTLCAFNGEQGVSMTREHRPDAVLMDIIMPGMTGFQATRTLHKDPMTNAIPVIIISASEQPTEKAWGKRLGARGFLAKPIKRGELFPCLESVLNQTEVATF